MQSIIEKNFIEHRKVIEKTLEYINKDLKDVGQIIVDCIGGSGCLFWCGNGGSAADSQHLAAELVGRFKKNRKPLRSVALTTDSSVLTCIANDFSYEEIFSRQIEALARKDDVLIVISTSGVSANITKALGVCKLLGVKTIALLGKDGGQARSLADYSIVIPSESTARIQEAHILIGHILCDLIENELGLA